MKASLESCMKLVNKSFDEQNKIIEDYTELIASLMKQVVVKTDKGNELILHLAPTGCEEKLIMFSSNRKVDSWTRIDTYAKRTVQHICLTTSKTDIDDALEEFVQYLCTKILPEFMRERSGSNLPHYIYV